MMDTNKTKIDRSNYIAAKQRQIDGWNVEMETLEGKAMMGMQNVQKKYRQQLDEIHAAQAEGTKRLTAVKEASEASWEKLKEDTENVFAAFRDSIDRFKSHF